MSAGAAPPLRYTGMRIKRLEDPRLLTGRGRYLDDLGLPRMLFASFVRSPYAHARIVRIDGAAALAAPRRRRIRPHRLAGAGGRRRPILR